MNLISIIITYIELQHSSTPRRKREIENLKEWLDVQFRDIHQKLSGVVASQDKLQQALLRKKSRQVR